MITKLKKNEVFVFGTNATGFHGAGAAGFAFRGDASNNWRNDEKFLAALQSNDSLDKIGNWAVLGVSRGFQKGHSGMSYGICTIQRPGKKRSIPLADITEQIKTLYRFALEHPALCFLVTKIGTQYAGYSVEEIQKCFDDAGQTPSNIKFV